MTDSIDSTKNQEEHQKNEINNEIRLAKAIKELNNIANDYEKIIFRRLQSIDDLKKKTTRVDQLSLVLSCTKFQLVIALEHQILNNNGMDTI